MEVVATKVIGVDHCCCSANVDELWRSVAVVAAAAATTTLALVSSGAHDTQVFCYSDGGTSQRLAASVLSVCSFRGPAFHAYC